MIITDGIIAPVRRLYTTTTSYTTSGTSEETAASYTLKGGTLANANQSILVVVSATSAANGNNKSLRLKFGGSTVLGVLNLTTNNGYITAEMRVYRKTATTQWAHGFGGGGASGAGGVMRFGAAAPAETLSGDITIACTLETGSAAGDLTFQSMDVFLCE